MTKKPYVISYSKKLLGPMNINYFLFAFELAEFFLRFVLTLNLLLFFYNEFLLGEIFICCFLL